MKVAIVVYSESGHTLEVARQLRKRLKHLQHEADILRIQSSASRKKLTATPSIEGYDALVLGAPVHALTLARPMKRFLDSLPMLGRMPVGVYVTQQFKSGLFGGNRALRYFRRRLQSREATLTDGGIVHWSSKARHKQIETVVERLLP